MALVLGANFKIDIKSLRAGISEANQLIRENESQFKLSTASMKDWGSSSDGVKAKIESLNNIMAIQSEKVKALSDNYKKELAGGLDESSKKASSLRTEINREQTALEKNKAETQELTEKLKAMEEGADGAGDAVEDLRAGISKANQLIKENESQFKLSTASMKDWRSSSDGVKAKIESLNGIMAIQNEKVKALSENYEKELARGLDKSSEKASSLRTEINREQTALEKNKAETQELTEKLKAMEEGADGAGDAMEDAGDQAEESAKGWTIGRDVIAEMISNVVTAGIRKIKEFGKAAIDAGMNFSASMSEVAAISGATAEQQALLEEKARELSSTSKFTASEVSQGFKYMALAGWSVEDSISGISGILDLAAASGMDLAKASDAVTDYLTAFGLEAKDSAKLADLLAYAQANANTSAEQMTEAYGNSAASLAAAGQDVETVTALLSMMANQGLKGSEAGTALAAVMRDITDKMVDGKIAIGDTSVTVADSEGNFRDLTDILADVSAATSGMGTAERAAAVSATFTARSLKGLNLILNAGTDEARSFEDRLRDSTGAASEMSEVMQDNLTGDVTKMKSALEDAEIELYKEFEPTLRSVAQTVTKKVIPGIKTFLVQMKNSKVVKAFGDGVKYIFTHLKDVIPIVLGAVTAIKGFKIVSSITDLFTKFGGAVKGLSATLAANPLGLAVTAIAGIATGIAAISAARQKAEEDAEEARRQKANVQYYEEQAAAIADTKQKWDDYVADVNQSTFDNVSEIDYYSNLFDELQNIVDESGKVKSGYEDRANFIVGELNEGGLLDKELKFNDGVIESYKDLQSEIANTIQLRRAQAILAGEEELATQARKDLTKDTTTYRTAQKDYDTAVKDLSEYEKRGDVQDYLKLYAQYQRFELAMNNRGGLKYLTQEDRDLAALSDVGTVYHQLGVELEKYDDIADQRRKYSQAQGEAWDALSDAQDKYNGSLSAITKYESDFAKVHSGNADLIEEVNGRIGESYIEEGKTVNLSLQEQYDNALTDLAWYQAEYNKGNKDITAQTVEEAQRRVNSLKTQLDASKPTMAAAAADIGTAEVTGFKTGIQPLSTEASKYLSDVAAKVKASSSSMSDSGEKVGTSLASGILSGFKKNMSSILEAAATLGGGIIAETNAAMYAAEVASRNSTNYTINQYNSYAHPHSDYENYKSRKLLEEEIQILTRGF